MLTLTGDIVTPEGILTRGALVINDGDGTIAQVAADAGTLGRPVTLDASGFLLVPGFLDMHVHGGGGSDFMDGPADAVRTVLRTHARFGTTGVLATTLTQSGTATLAALSAIGAVYDAPREQDAARLLGVHLEGPYICASKRGAQPAAFVRPPDIDELKQWVSHSHAPIKQITLAPELPGALKMIDAARQMGIIVSLGHTDADAAEANRAIDAGASRATHVFNAMRGLHHREPGLIGAVLTRPEVICEVIADGVHLAPTIVKLTVAAKGIDGICLITDAMAGTAMPDGVYTLGGFPVEVKHGTASFADGTLAGSVLTMDRAFANIMRFAGLSPAQASQAASTNAASQLGLSHQMGLIKEGLAADIVALHPDTGQVEFTLIAGRFAYRR